MKACKADLVGKGAGHDKGGVAGSAAQVEEAALGQHDHAVAVGEDEAVHLRLDVLPLHACTATAPPVRLAPSQKVPLWVSSLPEYAACPMHAIHLHAMLLQSEDAPLHCAAATEAAQPMLTGSHDHIRTQPSL